jgi:hypothetical protein
VVQYRRQKNTEISGLQRPKPKYKAGNHPRFVRRLMIYQDTEDQNDRERVAGCHEYNDEKVLPVLAHIAVFRCYAGNLLTASADPSQTISCALQSDVKTAPRPMAFAPRGGRHVLWSA